MKTITFKFDHGEVLKDKISGYRGVVLGRTDYLTDCVHYGLCQQKITKDGDPDKWKWFDETRLVRVKGAKKFTPETRETKRKIETSGPYPNAPSK